MLLKSYINAVFLSDSCLTLSEQKMHVIGSGVCFPFHHHTS